MMMLNRQLAAAIESGDETAAARVLRVAELIGTDVVASMIGATNAADGRSPLHVACRRGLEAIVSQLLAAGANVDAADRGGTTPLHFACERGHDAIVSQLLAAGAAVDPTTRVVDASGETVHLGETPLHYACEGGFAAVAAQLLKAGAAVDRFDAGGCTPLHVACSRGAADVVSLLLAAGAPLDSCARGADADGFTPLRYAIVYGHADCVRLCAAGGARRTFAAAARASEVVTAEEVASQHGHTGIAAWLARTRDRTTRLSYLELLTEAQARAELRAGAVLHTAARAGAGAPLSLARTLLAGAGAATPMPGVKAARLVLRAARPWSPANHDLFPVAARARAVELVRIGFQLSRDPRYSHAGQALMDTWREFVMAHAVRRDETGCHATDGDDGERTTRPRPRRSVRRTLFA